jgi:hypothetical protein
MATYVNDLRLKEITTGDESGTWGTSTNTNLELIAEAFSYGTEVITTNADTHTTTIADGATDPGRSLYLKYTGTLDSACTITIGPNTVSKVWIIENGTSGSQDIILSQGSGANITIPAGDTKVVYSDGAGAGAAFFDAFASLSVVDLKVQDDLTVTGDIDVDGTTNLDVVDIDGAVDMASTALVTGVLTTTAATVFNGGFASNAASTISTADNLDTLSLISTDADANSGPNLRLYRNSGSPADSDVLGHVQFEGRNDASQDVVYSEILTVAADVADGTEDAIVYIQSMVAGTVRERISILPSETVFNENSVDLDFRVESDNNANALFVQGSDGNVGIGVSNPQSNLDIDVAIDTSLGLRSQTGIIVAQYTGAPSVGNRAQIGLGYGNTYTNVSIGAVRTSAAAYGTDDFIIATKSGTADTAPTERLRIESGGLITAGTSDSSIGKNIRNWSTGGYIELSGDLPGYTNGAFPTLRTNAGILYISVNGTYSAYIDSNGAYVEVSDKTVKTNINTLSSGQLNKITNLRGVNYNWIDENRGTETQIGLIAQELELEYPELVSAGAGDLKGVNYAGLVSPLIEAVKELKLELDEAKARITTLENA